MKLSSPPPASELNRREFVRRAAVATAAAAWAPGVFSATAPATSPTRATSATTGVARNAAAFPICGLEKHFFERYTPEQTAQVFSEIGIDIERTVEVPLREGIVTAAMVNAIVGERTALPVCLHVEHAPLQPVPFAERARIVAQFRDDTAVLRQWLGLA